MPEPRFAIGQEVHIAQNHCALCKHLEGELGHPITVASVIPYGNQFTYRIEDVNGRFYETTENCLCSNPSGHRSSPCVWCGQKAA